MRLAASLLLLASAVPASAEVVVRVASGRVELTANTAPLADVLDRLARQTGMKVVYEGPAPRQLVTLSIHGRTPAETILAVFEGLGLNYAMTADATGAGVQTLVVAGAASATAASSPARGRPGVAGGGRRPFGPPPGSSPEPVEPSFDDAEEEPDPGEPDFGGMPPGAEVPEAGAQQPPGAPQNAPVPSPGTPQPGTAEPPENTPFSASPFTPQPQPFPPVPPGAPVGANPPQGQETKPQATPPQ